MAPADRGRRPSPFFTGIDGSTDGDEELEPEPARSVRAATRRIDPTGKHALFSTPPQAAPDQLRPGNQKDGRQAFFSTGPRQPGTVIVVCSSCKVRSRVTLVDLGVRLLSISVWIPRRRRNHWMRCPGCNQHTWCDINWTA